MGLVTGKLVNHYLPTNILIYVKGTTTYVKVPVDSSGNWGAYLAANTYRIKVRCDDPPSWVWACSPTEFVATCLPQNLGNVDGCGYKGEGD